MTASYGAITPVIDVHAHLLLPELHEEVTRRAPTEVEAAAALDLLRNGAESQAVSGPMVGSRIPQLTQLDARLKAMDEQGVDQQWVSVSPNHFYPWANEGLAVWVAMETNRLIAKHVSGAPDRLTGLGVVPLQHPERIVECIDDAVLGRGLAGIEISSFAGPVAGRTIELSDERLEPMWARLVELDAIVFVHPFGCSLDERLDRFYLANTVGQPVENAVALSHLIFSGVLDRHPKLKVIAAHGGGYLPTAMGRSDRAWHVRPEARQCLKAPSSYLSEIWFDTVVHDNAALKRLIEIAGPDRVVMGSDFPFDMGLDDPVGELSNADLPPATLAQVLGGNAAALIGQHHKLNTTEAT